MNINNREIYDYTVVNRGLAPWSLITGTINK